MMLTLRPLNTDDAHELVTWFKDEREVLSWGGPYFDFPLSPAALTELISEHKGQTPSRECWAVDRRDGAFVGSFQIAYNYRSGQAGLGRVVLKPDQRGKGLGSQMLKMAEEEAFRRPEINRLELRVFTGNDPALASYKRAGFVVEGTARQSARLGSEYWDALVMSKLRSEREL